MLLKRDNDQENVEVPMTPMIDAVFLLLIFFIVTASLKKPHKELEIDLPHASAAKVAKAAFNELIISIDARGRVYMGNPPQQMTEQELVTRLQDAAANPDKKPKVRIDADRQAQVHHMIKLMNLCQLYGLNTIGARSKE